MSSWWLGVLLTVIGLIEGIACSNESLLHVKSRNMTNHGCSLKVGLTIITNATDKAAVCLDGSQPAYHLDPGFGCGKNNWVIDLEGGGWCDTIKSCVFRKNTRHGSSKHMEKEIAFNGLLSKNPEENPDFYNWNRVRVRYCDGASFTGDSKNTDAQLQFRGQRIWSAVMEELMGKGMQDAQQLLLTGCSAGGLASIIHCDKFRALFNKTTKVKCLSDAGLFIDAIDISGRHTLRNMYSGVVGLRNLQSPSTCHLDPTSCFFPQNLIDIVKTPLFILNTAYDVWQIGHSLAPSSADPRGEWKDCKKNYEKCSNSQIEFLQEFRSEMLNAVQKFSSYKQNGLFINSCFSHCQSELPNTWLSQDSPIIGKKAIATAVGDWYFDRDTVDAIDCPYPSDNKCQNLVSRES